jgi:hypothetical protein
MRYLSIVNISHGEQDLSRFGRGVKVGYSTHHVRLQASTYVVV